MIRLNDLYLTIQGEGAMTGVPMLLVRLHGCGVGCPWCDTAETWAARPGDRATTLYDLRIAPAAWMDLAPEYLADLAEQERGGAEWILLTGGEPGEQDLGPLVEALHGFGFKVAVETSGTVPGVLGVGLDWICCSPKFGMPGGREVLPEVLEAADEIKMVVGNKSHIDRLETAIAGLNRKGILCLQPLSTLQKATDLCVTTCLAKGWRLSMQTHKFAGVR